MIDEGRLTMEDLDGGGNAIAAQPLGLEVAVTRTAALAHLPAAVLARA